MMHQRGRAPHCIKWAQLFNMQLLTTKNWTVTEHFWQTNAVVNTEQFKGSCQVNKTHFIFCIHTIENN